ncbi:GNAT family N-acetyltransferase [Nitrospira sp. KM1]|uniref:GNAT family N-acetyltransferase n=1 Tax=Nitrospira sp. KM1 TaxID=1936990 RepID=UPI00351AA059
MSSVFSHSFGENPKTGRPYRLGPKTTRERLSSTNYLFVGQSLEEMIAYLYARVINSAYGAVGWIDSLAVLPSHRRKGIATQLAGEFVAKVATCRWVGCATPNPIAALVITRSVQGTTYIGECRPPQEVTSMVEEIRPKCPDLRGTDFNPARLLVKTRFTPVMSEDSTEWKPPQPGEPPPWWASLENLPDDYEALLIIDRRS